MRFQPRYAITTSRAPPRRTRSFLTDFCLSIPLVTKISRGGKGYDALLHESRKLGIKGLFVVFSRQGNPSRIDFHEINDDIDLFKQPRFSWVLSGISLSRELGKRERPAFDELDTPKPNWLKPDHRAGEAWENFVSLVRFSTDSTSNQNENAVKGVLNAYPSRKGNLINFSFTISDTNAEVGPRIFVANFIDHATFQPRA